MRKTKSFELDRTEFFIIPSKHIDDEISDENLKFLKLTKSLDKIQFSAVFSILRDL